MDGLAHLSTEPYLHLTPSTAETKNEALPANMDGLAKLTTVSYLSLSAAKIQMILPHATKIQKISRTTKTPHAGSSASKTILTILFPHASRHLTTTIPDFPLLINSTRQDDVKTKQEQILCTYPGILSTTSTGIDLSAIHNLIFAEEAFHQTQNTALFVRFRFVCQKAVQHRTDSFTTKAA